MAASGAARVFGRLTGTRRSSPDPEDFQRAVRESGEEFEWTTADTIGSVAADQPARITGRLSDSAERTVTSTQRFLLGAGTVGGGTYVGSQYMDARELEAMSEEAGDQRDLVEQILNDESMTPEQREELIRQLSSDGVIDSPFEDDSGDSGGLLPDVPSLFSTEGVLLLIAVIYLGRAIARRAG